MVVQTRLTYADFEAFITLPENRERRFELIDGEIIEKMPTLEHGLITSKLILLIGMYFLQHRIGRVANEVRHKLPDDDAHAYLPDISVMLDLTRPVIREGAAPYMPDFAIEVKSPDDSLKALREKARYYLAHGCQRVWLVIPEHQLVEVYTLEAETIVTLGQTLDGGDLLPSFTLAVDSIFDV
jgi:Uma2 family endonuclease